MRTKCTYCGKPLGELVHNKECHNEPTAVECQNKKCKAMWSNEINYKEHL